MQEYLLFSRVKDGTHSMTQEEQQECISKIEKLREEREDLKRACRSMLDCMDKMSAMIEVEVTKHGD